MFSKCKEYLYKTLQFQHVLIYPQLFSEPGVTASEWLNTGYREKSNPITGLWGPEGFGRIRLPDSMTSALEGGRLSATRTGRLYPQEHPGTHFKRLSQPWTHGTVGCHGKNPY
jgi:hypothetical protein